eukprot:TRINITY_DN539_c0_g3_i2.p1 TRINITY_DN539_c0_g3~~TRINITY_DN539_c0_g3_i2.p1  ORF type:complete len:241 (-),score=39.89 TRINITY_DN539_c0_g3_i2:367-1089(-)
MKYITLAFLCCLIASCSASQTKTIIPGKYFDRLMVIMFENQGYDKVMEDPVFAHFASVGRNLDNFYAITHPSQPNYVAQLAGSKLSVDDDQNVNITETSVVDLLEAKGISWKSYQEVYPGNCFTGRKYDSYYRKHNPFMSFDNIRENPVRCANIVNSREFAIDLEKGTLPQFIYYTPDIFNDAHNTDIEYAGDYLSYTLAPLLNKIPDRMVVLITWDEVLLYRTTDNRMMILSKTISTLY